MYSLLETCKVNGVYELTPAPIWAICRPATESWKTSCMRRLAWISVWSSRLTAAPAYGSLRSWRQHLYLLRSQTTGITSSAVTCEAKNAELSAGFLTCFWLIPAGSDWTARCTVTNLSAQLVALRSVLNPCVSWGQPDRCPTHSAGVAPSQPAA